MIQESLILGTLWYVLSKLWGVLARSPLGRGFDAACRWIARQWRGSLIVGWFCSPHMLRGETVAPGRVRTWCCGLYQKLKLDALFTGSIFLQSFVWCALPVVIAPFAPTMAVLALALVGCASLLLRLLHAREHALSRDPVAVPVLVYAAIYLLGILTSVDVRGSFLIGVITLAFVLFSLALYHAVDTKAQLDALTALMVTAGASSPMPNR